MEDAGAGGIGQTTGSCGIGFETDGTSGYLIYERFLYEIPQIINHINIADLQTS